MTQMSSTTSFSDEDRQSLAESARLCEMIVEANPFDTGALETLKEIYTKLGDRERLGGIVTRLGGLVGARPLASGPSAPSRPSPSPQASASDRRPATAWRLGDRLVRRGSSPPSS
jgi:hypothetical protein